MSYILCIFLIVLGLPALHRGLQPEQKPEDLKKLFEVIYLNLHVKKDHKLAASLFQSLIPDETRLKRALREGLSAEVRAQIVAYHKSMPVNEENVAGLVRSGQSVVKLHAATTEEIARYEQGSVAYKEFPGGAKRVAEQILRKGVTFYEVEFLEPGKGAGVKYHLLYWDGEQWSMLGPVWRVLK
ncbi:MAG: hypothetical protein QXR28_05960 [Nitrososphaerota archaeon]